MEYKSVDCTDEPHLRRVQEEDKDRPSLCLETEKGRAYYTHGESAS